MFKVLLVEAKFALYAFSKVCEDSCESLEKNGAQSPFLGRLLEQVV